MMFYIMDNGVRADGPLGLADVVRRIRGGKITTETIIEIEGDAYPRMAGGIPELDKYFNPPEDSPEALALSKLNFVEIIKQAQGYFGENLSLNLISGSILTAGLLLMLGFMAVLPKALTALVAPFALVMFYFIGLVLILRHYRIGRLHQSEYMSTLAPVAKKLAVCAAIISVPAFGFALLLTVFKMKTLGILLLIPGCYALALHIFAPMIIADNPEVAPKEAMNQSRNMIFHFGLENSYVFFALLFCNLVAGLLFLPLFFSIPVSMIALVGLYETARPKTSQS